MLVQKSSKYRLVLIIVSILTAFLTLSCRDVKKDQITIGDGNISPEYLNQAIRIEPKIYIAPKWYYFTEEAYRYPTYISNISKQAYEQFKISAKQLGYVKTKFNPSNFNRDYLVLGKLPYQKSYTNNHVKYIPEVVNEGTPQESINLYLSDYQSVPVQDATKEHLYSLVVVKGYDASENPWGVYMAYDFKSLEDSSQNFIIKNPIEMGLTKADFVGSRYIPDFDTFGWKGINNFSGTLDGNYQPIKELTILRDQDTNIGLFKELSGKVKNIIIEDASVRAENIVGLLAGTLNTRAVVDGGVFKGDIRSRGTTGGIVGVNLGSIDQTFVEIDIKQTRTTYGLNMFDIGGFVGKNLGSISNSWNLGNVEGYSCVGSMVGKNQGKISKAFTLVTSLNLLELEREPRLKLNDDDKIYTRSGCNESTANMDDNTVFAPYYKINKVLFGERYWCYYVESRNEVVESFWTIGDKDTPSQFVEIPWYSWIYEMDK